jgi:teichuronic acid exporter
MSVNLFIIIIISRLLSPHDFGLVGLLSVFIAISNILLDSGFSAAIIRKNEHLTDEFLSSIFFFNIIVSLGIYIILYFLAPYIASFFEQNELIEISRILFLVIPINSLSLVQNSIFQKRMDFKNLAKVSLIATMVSGVVSISVAFYTRTYWALVYQSLLYSILSVFIVWVKSKWRPIYFFQIKELRGIMSYSFSLMLNNLIIVVFNNLFSLIIAKSFSISQVGFYNQARKLQELPSQGISSVIQKVSFPLLVKYQNDFQKLKVEYLNLIEKLAIINIPLMIVLFCISENLFPLLFTSKWVDSIDYFRILCFYGVFFPFYSLNSNILKVIGNTRKMVKLEFLRRGIFIIAILATLRFGIFYLLVGQLVSGLISTLIVMIYSGREINMGFFFQIKVILKVLLASFLMMVVLFLIENIFSRLGVFILIPQLIIGPISFVILAYYLKIESIRKVASKLNFKFQK